MKINLKLVKSFYIPNCVFGKRQLATNVTDEEKTLLADWAKKVIRDSHGKPSNYCCNFAFPNGLEGIYAEFKHISYGEWTVRCIPCRWSKN